MLRGDVAGKDTDVERARTEHGERSREGAAPQRPVDEVAATTTSAPVTGIVPLKTVADGRWTTGSGGAVGPRPLIPCPVE